LLRCISRLTDALLENFYRTSDLLSLSNKGL